MRFAKKKARRAAGLVLCSLFALGAAATAAVGAAGPVEEGLSPARFAGAEGQAAGSGGSAADMVYAPDGAGTAADTDAPGGAGASADTAAADEQPALTGTLTVYLEALYADELNETLNISPVLSAIRAFEAQHPGLTIRFESPVSGYHDPEAREGAIDRLTDEIAAGGGPDLFLFGSFFRGSSLYPDLQRAMREGAFADCAGLLAAQGVDCAGEAFWQPVMAAGRVGRAQFLVPLSFELPVALADSDTLGRSGFDTARAEQGAADFFSECAAAFARDPGLGTELLEYPLRCSALPVLDYDAGRVELDRPGFRQLLELQRAQALRSAPWLADDTAAFTEAIRGGGCDSYLHEEARRLAGGERLMIAGSSSLLAGYAWRLAAEGSPALLAVPDEAGGVTATVSSYGAIRQGSGEAGAAAALLAFLLQPAQQNAAAWPGQRTDLPVRRSSLAPAQQSAYRFEETIWWLDPTEEQVQAWEARFGERFERRTEAERAAHLEGLGQPLPDETLAQLAGLCGRVTAARLPSDWPGGAVPGGADGPVSAALEDYWRGGCSTDELIETLRPLLKEELARARSACFKSQASPAPA